MVELAAVEFPGFVVDDREVRRGGKSYTLLTLESLRAEVGATPLCLLVGSDAFSGLPTWHCWEQLFDLTHFVVMERPGAPLGTARALPWATERISQNAAELSQTPAGRIVFVPVTPLDVSATRLRAAIARGETPSPDALPAPVWTYINDHRLYRSTAA
jgi:nicotinate-nucleotide adenylyltransferase